MKTLSTIFLLASQILFTNSYADVIRTTYIQAEETKYQYIAAHEHSDKSFTFSECFHTPPYKKKCIPLFFDGRSFQAYQLKKMMNSSKRKFYYTGARDALVVALSIFYAGAVAGPAASSYYSSLGYSLEGVPAAAAAVIGVPTGATVGSTIAIALDGLDPFIHRDMAIALEEVLGQLDPDDLEDVQGRESEDGPILVIEDIEFTQLKKKIFSQLSRFK